MYVTGITINVRSRENIKPPTTTVPSGALLCAPEPSDSAIGKQPNVVASEVIKIGLNLADAASKAATRLLYPSLRF